MPRPGYMQEVFDARAKQIRAEEARKKAEAEKEELRRYRKREEIRGWITTATAVLALLLSVVSLIWQAPLH